MLTEISAAVAGGATVQFINYGYQKRKQRSQSLNDWYEDSLSLISRGLGICLSARQRSNLNYGNISVETGKISQELLGMVNPYPDGVDEEAVIRVKNLGVIFRKISAVTEASEDQTTMDALNEIFQMGKREYSSVEGLDMGEVVNESTEYSPMMESLFGELDSDPRFFGSQFEEKIEKSNTIDELLISIRPAFKNDQKTVEKALQAQILTDDWDNSLSVGVRVHLQIASNLCEDAINYISEINNMNTAN